MDTDNDISIFALSLSGSIYEQDYHNNQKRKTAVKVCSNQWAYKTTRESRVDIYSYEGSKRNDKLLS